MYNSSAQNHFFPKYGNNIDTTHNKSVPQTYAQNTQITNGFGSYIDSTKEKVENPLLKSTQMSNSPSEHTYQTHNFQTNMNQYITPSTATHLPTEPTYNSYAKTLPVQIQNVSSKYISHNPDKPSSMTPCLMTAQVVSEQFITEFSATADFVQSTTRYMPASANLKKKAQVPLGLIFQPLSNSIQEIPQVNFGTACKVIRCHRCRAYINPFVTWEHKTRRWNCNLCNFVNDTPHSYIGNLDETGNRLDRYEKKELSNGTVEFIASTDYMLRPPQPPTYLFLIDVSTSSVSCGLLTVACQTIKEAIESNSIPGGDRIQVAILTFDSAIHFYKLNSTSYRPEMLLVTSLHDVFIPSPDGIIVNLNESKQQLCGLLDNLPIVWSKQRISETCSGSALKAAMECIKQWGGRILLFMSSIPTLGDFIIKAPRLSKENQNAPSAQNAALKPIYDQYSELGITMTNYQISVHIFICPPAGSNSNFSMEVSVMAEIAKNTAGEIRFYPNFHAGSCTKKLRAELLHNLARQTGWEAVMRIRVSRGWKITNWYGMFLFRHPDLFVLPNCHADQTFTVVVDLQEQVFQDPIFYIQSALLYTNSFGERRIRISTLGLPVVQTYHEILASINEVAVMSVLSHQAIEQAQRTNLVDARRHLQTNCAQIFGCLQQLQNSSTKLPYYTLSLLKSVIFRESNDITPDIRYTSWIRFSSLPLNDFHALLSPRLYSLHDMPDEAGILDSFQNIILPPLQPLTGSILSQSGVYILEDGQSMLMWIGGAVDSMWIKEVFNVDSLNQISLEHAESIIGTTENQLSHRIATIINALRVSRLPFMKLIIIKQGDPQEIRFFHGLIEDRSPGCNITYAEFLQKIGNRATINSNAQPLLKYSKQNPSMYSQQSNMQHFPVPYQRPSNISESYQSNQIQQETWRNRQPQETAQLGNIQQAPYFPSATGSFTNFDQKNNAELRNSYAPR